MARPITYKTHKCKYCGTTDPTRFRERFKALCYECDKSNNVVRKRERLDADPIKKKATIVMGGLQWGRGGTQRMMVLVRKYLGSNCKYCGTELSLKNMSLDHKTPLAHSSRKPSKKGRYARDYDLSPSEILYLNSEDNLHFVCLTCNRAKGNLSDEEYTSLLDYLSDKPRVKQIVLAKLKGSNFMYRK